MDGRRAARPAPASTSPTSATTSPPAPSSPSTAPPSRRSTRRPHGAAHRERCPPSASPSRYPDGGPQRRVAAGRSGHRRPLHRSPRSPPAQPSAVYRLDDAGGRPDHRRGEGRRSRRCPLRRPARHRAAAPTPAAPASSCARTTRLYEFRIAPGAPFGTPSAAPPRGARRRRDRRARRSAYRPDGRGYYTTSEGANPPIHRVQLPVSAGLVGDGRRGTKSRGSARA